MNAYASSRGTDDCLLSLNLTRVFPGSMPLLTRRGSRSTPDSPVMPLDPSSPSLQMPRGIDAGPCRLADGYPRTTVSRQCFPMNGNAVASVGQSEAVAACSRPQRRAAGPAYLDHRSCEAHLPCPCRCLGFARPSRAVQESSSLPCLAPAVVSFVSSHVRALDRMSDKRSSEDGSQGGDRSARMARRSGWMRQKSRQMKVDPRNGAL